MVVEASRSPDIEHVVREIFRGHNLCLVHTRSRGRAVVGHLRERRQHRELREAGGVQDWALAQEDGAAFSRSRVGYGSMVSAMEVLAGGEFGTSRMTTQDGTLTLRELLRRAGIVEPRRQDDCQGRVGPSGSLAARRPLRLT